MHFKQCKAIILKVTVGIFQVSITVSDLWASFVTLVPSVIVVEFEKWHKSDVALLKSWTCLNLKQIWKHRILHIWGESMFFFFLYIIMCVVFNLITHSWSTLIFSRICLEGVLLSLSLYQTPGDSYIVFCRIFFIDVVFLWLMRISLVLDLSRTNVR